MSLNVTKVNGFVKLEVSTSCSYIKKAKVFGFAQTLIRALVMTIQETHEPTLGFLAGGVSPRRASGGADG